ncbi:hypothetical protein SETIT_6G103500v2 [Setaria italica]|uniref:Fatty acyl-CoA reductase n=1 Tax=Setaria italica TaxID=4555 RepID=K3YMA5_SETIT|nr:hypothetical protein SETIT_6G103500v2 [Setaria italica]
MISELDADGVVGYFRGKSILITGSTGFLGKVLVEKILRVQPGVKKLFPLIRDIDAESAKHRVQTEVNGFLLSLPVTPFEVTSIQSDFFLLE